MEIKEMNTQSLEIELKSSPQECGVVSKIKAANNCHCQACCTCTPMQRIMGMCAAHVRLGSSTSSLDSALRKTRRCILSKQSLHQERPNTDFDNVLSQELDFRVSLNQRCNDKETCVSGSTPEKIKSHSLPFLQPTRCASCLKPIKRTSHISDIEFTDKLCNGITLDKDAFCQCNIQIFCQNLAEPDLINGMDQNQTNIPGLRDAGVNCMNNSSSPNIDIDYSFFESSSSICSLDSSAQTELTSVSTPTRLVKFSPFQFKHRRQVIGDWFELFSHEQKNLLLKDLLNKCSHPQNHLLSMKLQGQLHKGCAPNCEDMLIWLPCSIALRILGYLDPESLCKASQVCWKWHQLASDRNLWKLYCNQAKWHLSSSSEQKQLEEYLYPDGNIDWKGVFAERYRLHKNWLHGRCYVRTFEGHTQGISCVQFDDTRIVSGSSDKTIKVWNIRTNSPWSVQTLVGHSGTVRCLSLQGNQLVSGSKDKSIKVWDVSTQKSWSSIACKVTMVGHQDTVRCLQVDEDKVISGSYDKTLKVWDIRTGQCRMTLRGHDAAVLCVQFDSLKIVSGSCDKTIKVWNFNGDCVQTLRGHHDAVTCLQFDETRIISGSLDCNLKIWDMRTGKCNNTIDWKASEGHTGVVRCLQADSWRVVSASDDRTLKVWSLETAERLVTLRNHTDGVTCLQFNERIIVSGSYDKTVKLWDFSCC